MDNSVNMEDMFFFFLVLVVFSLRQFGSMKLRCFEVNEMFTID